MKIYFDNLAQQLFSSLNHQEKQLFFDKCVELNLLSSSQRIESNFTWISLLEFLKLSDLFQSFPEFDQKHPLFQLIIKVLSSQNESEEIFFDLFDQIFVECLTRVKAIDSLEAPYLIESIEQKRQNLNEEEKSLYGASLNHYENYLRKFPREAMHDLVLYLAWERVCVYLAIIFEYIFPETLEVKGLDKLKDCLIESFMHITQQEKTIPSFYRMTEALFALDMREENLDRHTDEEWKILGQNASSLKSRDRLSDALYIDLAIIDSEKNKSKQSIVVFTGYSRSSVEANLSYARQILKKLQHEEKNWKYQFHPVEIVWIKKGESSFSLERILSTTLGR